MLEQHLEEVADQLGLASSDPKTYYGYCECIPIGILGFGEDSDPGMIIQFRVHRGRAGDSNSDIEILTPPDLPSDQSRIVLEDGLVSLTIYGALAMTPSTIVDAVRSVATNIRSSGKAMSIDGCHYCSDHEVRFPKFVENRIVQICDSCLAGRLEARNRTRHGKQFHVLDLVQDIAQAVVLGAVAWAAWCITQDWAIAKLFPRANRIFFPAPGWAGLILTVFPGALAGCVVGFIMKRSRCRENPRIEVVGATCGVLAAIVGDLGIAVFYALRLTQKGFVAPMNELVISYWTRQDFASWATLGISILVAGVVAYDIAKPPRVSLDL